MKTRNFEPTLRAWLMGAAVIASMVACGDNDEIGPDGDRGSGAVGDGKADQPAGDGEVLPTRNETVAPLVGYHGLFDRTTSTCVTPSGPAETTSVGALVDRYELVFLHSREALAQKLGFDLDLKARYHGIGGELNTNLLSEYSSTGTSVAFLINLESSYAVTHRGGLRMSDPGLDRLAEGAAAFVDACGANYIESVRYGASYQVLVTCECQTERIADELRASLGLSPGAPVPVEGTVAANLETISARAGVSVEQRAVLRGFHLPEWPDLTSDGELDRATLERVDAIRKAMVASREADMAHDICLGAGETCPSTRSAVPLGVRVGAYNDLPNVDRRYAEHFDLVRKRWSEVEDMSRALSRLHDQLEVVWHELDNFLRSGNKASYNVLPPASPRRDPTELTQLANHWSRRLHPRDDSITKAVFDVMEECWGRASDDLLDDCADRNWRALIDDGGAALGDYQKTARIVPLNAVIANEHVPGWQFWDGPEAPQKICGQIDPQRPHRLPTLDEVERLAPMIGFGPIAWDQEIPQAVWYDAEDASEACPYSSLPYYQNRPSARSTKIGCADSLRDIGTYLCVPTQGPFPENAVEF